MWHNLTYWPQKHVIPWQLDFLHGSFHLQICTAGSTTDNIHEATILCIQQFHYPFVYQNGKLQGCGEVLERTCCTKYTSTQSCPSMSTVYNKIFTRHFSRMLELGYSLTNIHV